MPDELVASHRFSGEAVRALGPKYAATMSGRVFVKTDARCSRALALCPNQSHAATRLCHETQSSRRTDHVRLDLRHALARSGGKQFITALIKSGTPQEALWAIIVAFGTAHQGGTNEN